MIYSKSLAWDLDSLDHLDKQSSIPNRPLSSSTQDSDSSDNSRIQRRRYMEKLRKLMDRLGSKKKSNMCYQAIRSSLVLDDEKVLDHSEEYDDHDSKCNCHEFFAELELAMAQSYLHARKRRAVMLSSHARAFSETTVQVQVDGSQYFKTSNHTPSRIDGFQLSPAHKNSVSATRRHTAGKPGINRWQRDSRNSSANFDFLENPTCREIRTPNEANRYPDNRFNMPSLETSRDSDIWVKEEYPIHLNSPPNPMTVSSFI